MSPMRKQKVSILEVEALWGDCRDVPTDQESYFSNNRGGLNKRGGWDILEKCNNEDWKVEKNLTNQ